MQGMARGLVAGVSACALAGCTSTYSFAPPSVELSRKVSSSQRNCEKLTQKGEDLAGPSIDTAVQIAENFAVSYRCAARELANGRMDFEIPSFLALAGGTTAAALGAGSSVAIATGTTSALFGAGQGYFDPATKFAIVRAGQNASTCVLVVASGGEGADIKKKEVEIKSLGAILSSPRAVAVFDSQNDGNADIAYLRKYIENLSDMNKNDESRFYNTVYGSLLSIDMIVSEKIASAGKIDFQDLKKRLEEIQGKTGSPTPQTLVSTDKMVIFNDASFAADLQMVQTPIDFVALEKKLQECVVRAHG